MTSENDAPTKVDPAHGNASDAESDEHAVAPPATAHEIARRQLLGKMSIGLGVACGAAISVPGVGFVVAPIFRDEPTEWRAVGKIDAFKIGETVNVVFVDASPLPWAGVTAKTAAWLRRIDQTNFVAFSVNCAHLGCPVRWFAQSKLFLCPCHGGAYYEDGSKAAGPPERGLFEYRHKLDGNTLVIHAGDMPTLATQASCGEKPLIQIQPADAALLNTRPEEMTPWQV